MIKFEKVERIKDNNLKLPERNTANAAGYDFYNPEEVIMQPGEIKYVKTGVKAQFPSNLGLFLFNRSSNPKKRGLILINGVGIVDSDYYNNPDNEGEIAFAFKNTLKEEIILQEGDKLGQGVFIEFKITDNDNAEGERMGGFGSTGR